MSVLEPELETLSEHLMELMIRIVAVINGKGAGDSSCMNNTSKVY